MSTRTNRKPSIRPKVHGIRMLRRELRAVPVIKLEEATTEERPKTRGDCAEVTRPCPWVGCKFHLYLDVLPNGSIRLNFPNKEPEDLEDSCCLDLAEDRAGMTLDEVGEILCVSRERIRQLEARGLRLLKHLLLTKEKAGLLELRNDS